MRVSSSRRQLKKKKQLFFSVLLILCSYYHIFSNLRRNNDRIDPLKVDVTERDAIAIVFWLSFEYLFTIVYLNMENLRVTVELCDYNQQRTGEGRSQRTRHRNEAMGAQIFVEGCLM
jgi:hypothetical protein